VGHPRQRAYQTLKNPQKRAQYLCELNGVDLQTESNTAMPMAFLMQQMEWREELGDARAAKDSDALESLDDQLRGPASSSWRRSNSRSTQVISAAAKAVRDVHRKFGEEVRFAFEAIEA
jgi:molecular chaperone HscB